VVRIQEGMPGGDSRGDGAIHFIPSASPRYRDLSVDEDSADKPKHPSIGLSPVFGPRNRRRPEERGEPRPGLLENEGRAGEAPPPGPAHDASVRAHERWWRVS